MAAAKKYRNTRQKQLIAECLKNADGIHLTAEDIVSGLKQAGTPVGKATVYRALAQMEAEGRVKRYETVPNGACFSYIGEGSDCNSHYHAVCTACGLILHLESGELDRMSRQLNREKGFVVDDTKTVVYGRCRNCVNEKLKEKNPV